MNTIKNGKGDIYRPVNKKKYDLNYDFIDWKKKTKNKQLKKWSKK